MCSEKVARKKGEDNGAFQGIKIVLPATIGVKQTYSWQREREKMRERDESERERESQALTAFQ